jgi:hypothetical protein
MPLDVILSFNHDSSEFDFDLLILRKVFHQSDRSRSIPSSLRLKNGDDSFHFVWWVLRLTIRSLFPVATRHHEYEGAAQEAGLN